MNYLQNNLLTPIFLTIWESLQIQLQILVLKLTSWEKVVVYFVKPKPFPDLLPKRFPNLLPISFHQASYLLYEKIS